MEESDTDVLNFLLLLLEKVDVCDTKEEPDVPSLIEKMYSF
jgi:hypothetical protein